jgi:hypothetical protein
LRDKRSEKRMVERTAVLRRILGDGGVRFESGSDGGEF